MLYREMRIGLCHHNSEGPWYLISLNQFLIESLKNE